MDKFKQTQTCQQACQHNNFADKLARVFEACGVTKDADLARALDIKPQSVSAARRSQRIPSGWIELIAEKYHISSDWLFFGDGPMRRGAPGVDSTPATPSATPQAFDPEIALIPKVKARLSAGSGSLETSEEVVGLYAFKRKFLNRKGIAKEMVLMDVSGDSMEPEIKSGDTVLIDKSQTEIIAGSVYAVGMDEEVVVKVVDKSPGKLILRSYNKTYSPFELDMRGDLAAGVRIIGRVIWWCREAR